MNRATWPFAGLRACAQSARTGSLELPAHPRELGPLELIPFDEIEPVSSPRRSARCRSRAISKSGARYRVKQKAATR
jgi:hypothetical protein